MSEPLTISPAEPANKGVNYSSLKEEGLKLIQQLASDIWTDYNEHDPGVTTLEQLCYALTELSYRAEFPLKDLLIDRKSGRIKTRRQALFIPRRILTCNPVTENDYRKLLVDRIPQVANVWLTPYRSPLINGLYEIAVYAPGADPCACDKEYLPAEIRRRVLRVYCRHRALCENVYSIIILKPVPTVVNADVNINDARAPEAILAGLFFELGNFLAPELHRQSLKSLLGEGKTSDEIFNGPLLRNGFIDDGQLQPKATAIRIQDIISVMANRPGVISARNVSVRVGDNGKSYQLGASIEVPEGEILQIDTRSNAGQRGYSIRLYRNGVECQPNPMRVQRELDKLWADYRRTYRLMPQYEEFFAVPQGHYRDVKPYYSIQNQYPNVYGINSFGLPDGAPPARRGQAKQLKGYLLVFEQLLADFFAQLAHAKDLYSIEAGLRHTYFYQLLTESVPNVKPLLKESYRDGLKRLVRSEDAFVDRRNRFLDFLLALYADEVSSSSIAELAGCGGQNGRNAGAELIGVKLALLRNMIALTHNRGRGIDYLALPTMRNIAGMEIKCRIQLGMNVFDNRPLIEVLDELGLELVEPEAGRAVGGALSRHADYIEENFAPVTAYGDAGELSSTGRPGQSSPATPLLRAQRVTESFLRAAERRENFRAGSLPGETTVALVCKSPSETDWHMVARHPDLQSALASVSPIIAQMRALYSYSQQLYIVEHTLLWYARPERGGDPLIDDEPDSAQSPDEEFARDAAGYPAEVDFSYSFTITAVVSALPRQLNDRDFQRIVREAVRQNTPAHIVSDFCFLRPAQMRRFEALYWDWRRALRHRKRREIIITSNRLRSFLQQCQQPGLTADG